MIKEKLKLGAFNSFKGKYGNHRFLCIIFTAGYPAVKSRDTTF